MRMCIWMVASLCLLGATAVAGDADFGDTVTDDVKLTGNISGSGDGLTIGASGITIDLNGKTISSTDGTGVGIHNPDQPRTCSRRIKLNEVNGDWQVFDVGPWKPTEKGGVFYIARGRAGVSEVYLDCLWLIESPMAPDK